MTTFYKLIDDCLGDWKDIKIRMREIKHAIVMNTIGSHQLID